jgi:hypothetical protein
MEALFRTAVFFVDHHAEAGIQKNLLGFQLTHIMLIGTLASVALVPIEANDTRKVYHHCILP